MAQNPNVRFGRKIGPINVKDVQKGNIQRLYTPLSTDPRSVNITVGAEPVVVAAFGLKDGETVAVHNVFENNTSPLFVYNSAVMLDATHTLHVLPISGVYCLIFDGEALGDLVVIAYKLSAMDPKTANSVDITNPNGPQQNRPNLFLDGSYGVSETRRFFVGSTPLVFRAYGLEGQVLELYSVFEDREAQVFEESPVIIS